MVSPNGSPICRSPVRPPLRMLYGFLVSAAIFLVPLSAFAQESPGPDSENESNSIRGVVVNSVTHEPIGRALVHSADNRYATMTDDEGHFEFTRPKSAVDDTHGLSGGRSFHLTLLGRKPGFLDDSSWSQPNWIEASAGTEANIALTPEALIKGKITIPSGESVRGATVQLYYRQVQQGRYRWQMMNSVQANSNGEFRFADLHSGTYRLFTTEWMDNDPETFIPGGQMYGYPPVYYPNAEDFARRHPLN